MVQNLQILRLSITAGHCPPFYLTQRQGRLGDAGNYPPRRLTGHSIAGAKQLFAAHKDLTCRSQNTVRVFTPLPLLACE
jgi:hypothetical protein